MEQALEAVPEEKQEITKTSDKDSKKLNLTGNIRDKLEELNGLEEYSWLLEPTIEADDIFYQQADASNEESMNDTNKQMMYEYAVIRSQNQYGLIGLDGQVLPMNELNPGTNSNEFYYCEGLHNIAEVFSDKSLYDYPEAPSTPIPVQQTDKIYSSDTYNSTTQLFGAEGATYALYANGSLVTGFDYEDMGSWSEGLIAAKKNGKWGYINEKGEVIIPFEYDSSWTIYPQNESETEKQMAYAASEGFVVLCKDGVWEMRSTEGKLVIMSGVFDQICPVYYGTCWVKRDDKWGIITLENASKNISDKQDAATALSAMTPDELNNAIIQHYNQNLVDPGATYTIMDSEVTDSDEEYQVILRYQMSDKEAEEIMARGGLLSANTLVGIVTVNKKTGTVTDDFSSDSCSWSITY